MDNSKIKVGIIGFGRMGGKYLDKFLKNGRYEVAYICDVNKEARDYAAKLSPSSTIVADEQIVFEDPKVQVVALCTLANFRKEQIDKAVRYGKHIISENPWPTPWNASGMWYAQRKTRMCSPPSISISATLGIMRR